MSAKVKKILKKQLKKYKGKESKLNYKCDADRDHSVMVKAMKGRIFQPSFNSFSDKIHGLGITIHGFEGNAIELTSVEKKGSNYTGILHFTFWDNFGLDQEDVKEFRHWKGFGAWYILQHYKKLKGRHKPFQTVIEFDETF